MPFDKCTGIDNQLGPRIRIQLTKARSRLRRSPWVISAHDQRSDMKKSLLLFCFLAVSGSASFAAERTVLARITGYWPMGSSNARGCGTGAILRNGHCAVDPKAIPYRSKVIFPDAVCEAVDSGPAVVSRKSARSCGRTKAE